MTEQSALIPRKQVLAAVMVCMLCFMVSCTPAVPPSPEQPSVPAPAASAPTPESVPAPAPESPPAPSDQVPRITIEALKQKMESGAAILVVDNRKADQYQIDHIEGAISVPLEEITDGLWLPPPDKEIIFYCA